MSITKEYADAVEKEDLLLVRIMLKDIMLIDTSLKKFDEMLIYAENKIHNLYDSHDGEDLENEQEKWTKEYMNSQMVVLVNNFSLERIELLRKIVKYIFPDSDSKTNNSYSYNSDTRSSEKTHSFSAQKKIGTGLVGVGAIVTVGGILASEGALIAGGIGVAVIGTGLILADKR